MSPAPASGKQTINTAISQHLTLGLAFINPTKRG